MRWDLLVVLTIAILIAGGWFLIDTGSADSHDCSTSLEPPYIAGMLEVAEQGGRDQILGYTPRQNATVYLFNSSIEGYFNRTSSRVHAIEHGQFAPAKAYTVNESVFRTAATEMATTESNGCFSVDQSRDAHVVCLPDYDYHCFEVTGDRIAFTAQLIPQTRRYRFDIVTGSRQSYFVAALDE